MSNKRHLSDNQRFGLSEEESTLATKYMRKYKTTAAIPQNHAIKLYELFMVGYTFAEIHAQFPQFPIGQIIMTASLKGWCKDRELMMGTLKDRIQARVVKSVLEQVDFLSTLIAVTNAQHLDSLKSYLKDPKNTQVPSIAIQNIKEYKDVAESLNKLVSGVATTEPAKKGIVREAMKVQPPTKTKRLDNKQKKSDTIDITALAAADEADGKEVK